MQPQQALVLAYFLSRGQPLDLDRGVRDDILHLLVRPDIMFERGDVEIAGQGRQRVAGGVDPGRGSYREISIQRGGRLPRTPSRRGWHHRRT